MTFLDIARRLDAEATKGPWWDESDRDSAEVVGQGLHGMERPVAAAPHGGEKDEANMALIAFTRSTLPEVAALVEAVKAACDKAPATDPCADEYDADGVRRDEFGRECDYCTFTSDEASEVAAHKADVAAYAIAQPLRTALAALNAKAASLGGAS